MSTGTTTTTAAAPVVSAADVRRWAASPLDFFCEVRLVPDGPRFGDIMTEDQREFLTVVAPCLLAIAQRRRPPTRGVFVEAVKGWGKDSLAALGILWLLVFSPWNVLIQIAADDQQQAGEVKRALLDWLLANSWLSQRVDCQRWKILNESTGAECEILTADATGSHGARPNLLCVNELSHIQSEDYASTLMDNFTKMPDAFAMLCTNAGFTQTWCWKWRELYRTDPRWFFQKITATPSWQTEADIAEASKRCSPTRFARLYRGEWCSPGGDLLSAAQIERAVVYDSPLWGDDGWANIGALGVDLGVASHHSSICVLQGSHVARKLRVARIVDFRPPTMLEFVKSTILRLAQQFGIYSVYLDCWQALRLSEELAALGFTVYPEAQTGPLLSRQASALLQAFSDDVLQLHRGDESADLLIRDLQRARICEKSYGYKIESDVDEFGHGDRLSSLLQALPSMLETLGGPPAIEYEMPRAPRGGLGEQFWGTEG